MKKLFYALSVAAVAMFFASCENPTGGESGENLAKAVAGSYEGYTSASCAMFEDMVTAGEKLTVAANEDGTAKITFASETWGTFSAETVKVTASGDNYALNGAGKVSMAMGDAEPVEYDFTVEGTISSDKKEVGITYVCPAVMGGLTIVFRDGEAPVEPSENLAEKIAGDYSGYSSASCAMFEDMVTAGEKLTVAANEDGTAKITFASETWGTFSAETVKVTASGDNYALNGEGKVLMAMGDAEPVEYDFTVEGTISSDKKEVGITYVCPAVMGGLTIVFNDGDAPAEPSENLAEKIAGDYSGYSSASCAMFEDKVTAGEELTVVANEDGTAKITMISSVWGTFNAESVAVAASGEDFTISGEGKVSMAMGGGDPKEYDFTVEGTVTSDKKVEITYVCPAVMGGLTIVFRDGEAPVEPSENLAEKIAGDYSGYSSASCAMFEDKVTAGEELTVVANEDGTAKITMISSVWGTFNAENIAVAASGEDFTISGEGKVSMSMGGGDPKEYDFTVEGTVTSDKKVAITYVCPAVMGGLTIVFNDGDAPVTE